MSFPAIETALWSRRRWFLTIFLLFVAQTALIFRLTGYLPDGPRRLRATPNNRIISGAAYEAMPDAGSLIDPTLFALPHPNGFSGAAWLKSVEFPLHLTNEVEPPRWLWADTTSLALEFARLMQTNLAAAPLFSAKPSLFGSHEPATPAPSLVRPTLRIEGELASRRLVTAARLPEADRNKILNNCVITVMVSADGDVLSALYQMSSGSVETDRAALKFAWAARFEPLTRGDRADSTEPFAMVFGRLVFEWLLTPETRAVPASNP